MSFEARLTDRKPLTAAMASENLVFYVVDQNDLTEHPSGSSYRVSKAELKAILGVDLLLNEKFVENPSYADIPAMLADQANQTPGKVQHVVDATGDITVVAGYAYYEYLGPATASLINYRKLSASEVALLQNNTGFTTFNTEAVSEALAETVATSKISFEYAADAVTKVLFDKVFTAHLQAFNSILATKNIELVLFNRTKQKTLIATVTAFAFSNVDNLYYEASVASTIDKDDVSVNDVIEVKLDVSIKVPYTGITKISGFWFDTKDNVNQNAIEVGNTFNGWDDDTYVVGKVISLPVVLPDDLYDDTKIKLAINAPAL
ncbi:hypothetical protein CJ739_95 [Mariniflexile rhizosphaerae]|uniref:hypothetical protein n=1 Tax=unclassified Mariniflexile TaxID=2643887 RepID=UPI000E336739|nr:hypothetical protein [Mariniflexile sp. TRM1-10]AXP79195.1 hypothetical protein CJ739_95 [Mariniflexile sp. TRM1-10]